jgi:hypothetical protein
MNRKILMTGTRYHRCHHAVPEPIAEMKVDQVPEQLPLMDWPDSAVAASKEIRQCSIDSCRRVLRQAEGIDSCYIDSSLRLADIGEQPRKIEQHLFRRRSRVR